MGDINFGRMKSNPWLRGLLLTGLVVLALWMARSEKYTFSPNTTFTTITGKHLALKDLQGKPVLITFWATSCGSCIKEIPHLIALYKQFHQQGLEIIAVAMAYDPPDRVVAMAKELNLPYPIVLDITAEHARAFGRIWATPTTVLINPEGTLAKRVVGAFDPADMQNRIEQLLKSTSPSPIARSMG
ncbi:redoxin domain-containing protein [Methyloglobulus morosus KoM1]|uniref:Redoxin domain-containing protein n=2 Tax=Methyloglobulus TaxID=1410680 RepID=V5C122_9GAMM|nr:redoxin domain-containing protein [Methyloglobulus morosus KoM1]